MTLALLEFSIMQKIPLTLKTFPLMESRFIIKFLIKDIEFLRCAS